MDTQCAVMNTLCIAIAFTFIIGKYDGGINVLLCYAYGERETVRVGVQCRVAG
jgi:hypothetical protein